MRHGCILTPRLPPLSVHPPREERAGHGRLAAWLTLAALLALLGFASAGVEIAEDDVYRWESGIGGVLVYGFVLLLVLAIARPPMRETLALRRPRSWRWALWAALALVLASFAFDHLYDAAFGPFDVEQGVPDFWDGSRAPQFALGLFVIAVLGPVVEELLYRGVGHAVLERYGTWVAIGGTALLFALAHGYLHILPIFLVTGIALGWLRARSGSVLPGILAHGVFNAAAVVLTIALESR